MGRVVDPETGLIYLQARYYDPATAQFLTRDPADALTRSAYGYVYGNPLNGRDPTGLGCGLSDLLGCASDVWHPVRAALTAPESLVALSVDKVFYGSDCDWNSKNWVSVCTNAPTLFGAPASTFGNVVNVNAGITEQQFAGANPNSCGDGRLLAHETKHSDQWAIFGPLGFPIAFGLDTLQAEARATVFGGPVGQRKGFEEWAGLQDGGYTPPSVPIP